MHDTDNVRELTPAGAVRLWLVRTDAGPADDTGMLDAAERRRAAAFRFDRDRDRYVAAHLALRTILAGALAADPGRLSFTRRACPRCGEPHGRPALTDFPDAHFSLSHSGDLALVALAPAPVGADVEVLPPPEAVAELISSLHPVERAELAAYDGLPERRLALARTWVRKEAYLKGVGTGLSLGAHLDYVGSLPHSPGAPDGWTVVDVPVPDGYTAAVAISPVP